jgi:hypothetical protein
MSTRALLCVTYDTMARRNELVGFDVEEDVELMPSGSGRMMIQRSKTDQAGAGKPKDATMLGQMYK